MDDVCYVDEVKSGIRQQFFGKDPLQELLGKCKNQSCIHTYIHIHLQIYIYSLMFTYAYTKIFAKLCVCIKNRMFKLWLESKYL